VINFHFCNTTRIFSGSKYFISLPTFCYLFISILNFLRAARQILAQSGEVRYILYKSKKVAEGQTGLLSGPGLYFIHFDNFEDRVDQSNQIILLLNGSLH
jgi:hypothetical protein